MKNFLSYFIKNEKMFVTVYTFISLATVVWSVQLGSALGYKFDSFYETQSYTPVIFGSIMGFIVFVASTSLLIAYFMPPKVTPKAASK